MAIMRCIIKNDFNLVSTRNKESKVKLFWIFSLLQIYYAKNKIKPTR